MCWCTILYTLEMHEGSHMHVRSKSALSLSLSLSFSIYVHKLRKLDKVIKHL
jgi:hypothetical protein